MQLSIIIPIFNEHATLEELIRRVVAAPLPGNPGELERQLVLVDDASTDGSSGILRGLAAQHPDWIVCFHERNRGKGAAVRTGLAAATGEIILLQDADLEYDPSDYPALLAPILQGRADVVFGSRFIGGGPHRVLYFWHSVGNRLLTLLSNMFTNINLSDMEVCYKVFRREVVQGLKLQEARFGFEPELTVKIAKAKCWRIYEVPVAYYGRTYAEGKKITWRDGFRAFWCIMRYTVCD